ncbi:MAG: hypothetical protein ONB06_07290 [candidate division KSB1 bacterium]|nr:hypothetical protein [candidate division KSB1 bacterium]
MLTSLLSALIVVASLGVTLYIVSLLFSAAAEPLEQLWEYQRFEQHRRRASQSDAWLQAGAFDLALQCLRAGFYLHPVRQRRLSGEIVNHHAALLARLIALTNELCGGSVRLFSLARADRLLADRAELQRRFLRACELSNAILQRQLLEQLDTNGRDLRAALDQLFAEVQTILHTRSPATAQMRAH